MAAHLYWSLNITATQNIAGGVIEVGDLKFKNQSGVNVCTGGTASATSFISGYPAINSFDGNLYSSWISEPPLGVGQRLTYQLASPDDIYTYEITKVTGGNDDSNPESWTLEYSDDGIAWSVADTQANYVFSSTLSTFSILHLVTLSAVDSTAIASSSAGIAAISQYPVAVNSVSTASSSVSIAPTAQTLTAVDIASTAASSTGSTAINRSLSVIDSVSVTSSSLNNITVTRNLTPVDSMTVASSSIANVSLTVFLVPMDSVATHENVSTFAVYLAINYALDNKTITTYSNFNFTGSCRFNGKTLFINDKGMFEHGGLTDNGAAIVPSLKTGKMDMVMGQNGVRHTQQLKKIPTSKVYVSADKTGGSLDLIVSPDTQSHLYNQAVLHDGFTAHAIKIGRQIKYNHMSIEIIGNGCSRLDIGSIRFNPAEITRSER